MPVYGLDHLSPSIPLETWIAPDAHVIGHVVLGHDVGIWFGAVLRGDNEPIVVGRRTNIQEGSILHTDKGYPLTVGEGCTIGHRAIIHGCTIGDHCLVGMGATILNGARIAAHCLVGAGALVTENKSFPEGSLIVGAPAKVIRSLTELEIQRLYQSAEAYAENARRFKERLVPIRSNGS